jgi:hypothetical protein
MDELDDYMPEPFCVCGHDAKDHDAFGNCKATEPEPKCSCRGYRKGTRSV